MKTNYMIISLLCCVLLFSNPTLCEKKKNPIEHIIIIGMENQSFDHLVIFITKIPLLYF